MVSIRDLRRINIFRDAPDEVLEEIAKFCQLKLYSPKDVLFREGEMVREIYMLLHGKVLIEVAVSPTVSLALDAMKAGYIFGVTSLLPEVPAPGTGICVDVCEIMVIEAQKMKEILESFKEFAYIFMTRVANIFRLHLEARTKQFLKIIQYHPELKELFELK